MNGREPSGLDVLSWVKEAEKLGVGEIILSSIDQDGTEKGMDLELIEKVTKAVEIPVIASSGDHNIKEIKRVLEKTNVSGIAIGSALHSNNVNIKENKKEINL